MNIKFRLAVLFYFAFVIVSIGQTILKRAELPLCKPANSPYFLTLLNTKGLLIVSFEKKTRDFKFFTVRMLDTVFNVQAQSEFVVSSSDKMVNSFSDSESVYLIFRSFSDFKIVNINLNDLTSKQYNGKTDYSSFEEFYIKAESVIHLITTSQKGSVGRINLNSIDFGVKPFKNTHYTIEEEKAAELRLYDCGVADSGTSIVTLSSKFGLREEPLLRKIKDGKVINEVKLKLGKNRLLHNARIKILEDGRIYVAGFYYVKENWSEMKEHEFNPSGGGIFLAELDNFHLQMLKIYPYNSIVDMNNIYYSKGPLKKIEVNGKLEIESQKDLFVYQKFCISVINDIKVNDSDITILYDITYEAPTIIYNPMFYFGKYGMNGKKVILALNTGDFNFGTKSGPCVLNFSYKGDLNFYLGLNSMQLISPKLYSQYFSLLEDKPFHYKLMSNYNGKLNVGVLSKDTSYYIPDYFAAEDLRLGKISLIVPYYSIPEFEGVFHWYDNRFLAYGRQKIKPKGQKARKVFYLEKVEF